MAQPEFMKKHGIKTIEVESLLAHSNVDEEVKEKTVYIIGTNTLTSEAWVDCNVFTSVEESLHHHGILKYIAVYLHYDKGMPYEDIYNLIIAHAKNKPDSVLRPAYDFIRNYFESIKDGKPIELYSNPVFGEATWVPKKVAHLAVINHLDEFYCEIRDFLHNLGVENGITDELIEFQKTVLKLPHRNHFSADFEYDWAKYFRNALAGEYSPLEKNKIRISVDNEVHQTNWKDYAMEAVWFGVNGITINPGIKTEYI